jgi:hypothetical protein
MNIYIYILILYIYAIFRSSILTNFEKELYIICLPIYIITQK